MSMLSKFGCLAAGLLLAACQTATHFEATNTKQFKPRDKELLAKIRYVNTPVPQPYRRAVVDYHRKEAPGSILVDSDSHYLYYVLDGGKAIRYGVTVGEEALAFSGVARVGNMREWPDWIPTSDIHKRIEGLPQRVAGGPDNPLGVRALYLSWPAYLIHGTHDTRKIGRQSSDGCIGLYNEHIAELFSLAKVGTQVLLI